MFASHNFPAEFEPTICIYFFFSLQDHTNFLRLFSDLVRVSEKHASPEDVCCGELCTIWVPSLV